MSIAQQIATPARPAGHRRPARDLKPAPAPRRGRAFAHIVGLVTATALCTALMAGAAVVGILLVASSLGG